MFPNFEVSSTEDFKNIAEIAYACYFNYQMQKSFDSSIIIDLINYAKNDDG